MLSRKPLGTLVAIIGLLSLAWAAYVLVVRLHDFPQAVAESIERYELLDSRGNVNHDVMRELIGDEFEEPGRGAWPYMFGSFAQSCENTLVITAVVFALNGLLLLALGIVYARRPLPRAAQRDGVPF